MKSDRDGLGSRRAALQVLEQVRDGRPFGPALDRAVASLADPDRRLAHELAAGVLRQRSVLDQSLRPRVRRGWDSVPEPLQDILRLGAYQLTVLDRVPAHAAVETTVSLAREAGGTRAAGFVNAVLRRLAREGEETTREPGDETTTLAARFSHPEWLVNRWLQRFGRSETERLLQWNNTRPALVLQPARLAADTLADQLSARGIQADPAPYGAGLVVWGERPEQLPGYAEGHFIVQDPAQALVVWFADVPPGATVYDACAAPGGKTIALGRWGARIVAGDASRQRIERLRENLARSGSGREHAVVANALRPPLAAVDVVLLDAPCLGTGTFGRHPDARWRVTAEALQDLARQQRALLEAAARIVRPGGLLIYSTCSLEPEEDEMQVERFLARHPEFSREPADAFPAALLSPKGDLMTLPQRDLIDGAYAARLRRAA